MSASAELGLWGKVYDFIASPVEGAFDIFTRARIGNRNVQIRKDIERASSGNKELADREKKELAKDQAGLTQIQAERLAEDRKQDRKNADDLGGEAWLSVKVGLGVAVFLGLAYGGWRLFRK